MKNFKRIMSSILAIVMCFALQLSVFATESLNSVSVSEDTEVASEVITEEDPSIMPLGTGSISGYAYKRVRNGDNAIIIPINGNGIGGMGITIKTASSYQGEIAYHGALLTDLPFTWASDIDGKVSSNGEKVWSNLNHATGNNFEYIIAFDMPAGVEMDVWVWIYG